MREIFHNQQAERGAEIICFKLKIESIARAFISLARPITSRILLQQNIYLKRAKAAATSPWLMFQNYIITNATPRKREPKIRRAEVAAT